MELADDGESGVPEVEQPEYQWPEWSGYIQHAWQMLRDDRHYGAMGGMGAIYYTAMSQYAHDHQLEIEPFATFLNAMDEEYVLYCAEQAKETTPPEPE